MKLFLAILLCLLGCICFGQTNPGRETSSQKVFTPASYGAKSYKIIADSLVSKTNNIFRGKLAEARAKADGFNAAIISDYGGGTWYYDASDNSSADNTGTVFVTVGGARFKRVYQGYVNVFWFGAKGDGIANDAAAFQRALNNTKEGIFIPKCDSFYNINDTVVVPFGVSVAGYGKVMRSMPLSKNTWLFKLKGNNKIDSINYDGGSSVLSEGSNSPFAMKDFVVDSFGNVTIRNSSFKNSCGSFIGVINPYSFSHIDIVNNIFNGQRDHAIYLQGGNVKQGKGLAVIDEINIMDNTFLDDGTIRNHVVKLKNLKNVKVIGNTFKLASRAVVIDGSLDFPSLTSLPDSNIIIASNTGYCYEFVTCIVGEASGSGASNVHHAISISGNVIKCVNYAVGSAYPPTSTVKYYGNVENISVVSNSFTCKLGILFNGNILYGGIKKALISNNEFHIVNSGNSVLAFYNSFNTIDFLGNTIYFDTAGTDKAIINTSAIVDYKSSFIASRNGRIDIKDNKVFNGNALVIERPLVNTNLTSLNFDGYFSGNQLINKNQPTRFFNLTSTSLSVNPHTFNADNTNLIISAKSTVNILGVPDTNSSSYVRGFVVAPKTHKKSN